MARVSVIGAGVGGLATAIRLSQAGHSVHVYEKNEQAGGKLASRIVNGFMFDTGPSLLTMPQYLEDLGITFARKRLDAPFRYQFSDGSTLQTHDDYEQTADAFAHFASGADDQWRHLMKAARRAWEVSERTFLAGPMDGRALTRLRSPRDFKDIDPLFTLHGRSQRTFSDPRLQQWLDRYATYSGSSPFRAPATLKLIPHLEQTYGCWHVPGGLGSLASRMVERAESLGATFHFDSEVTALADIQGDVIVANVDAGVLYSKLVPRRRPIRSRAPRSTAGFAMLLGLNGRTANLAHHNVRFSDNYRGEFCEIETSGRAENPTIYVCCSAVTSPEDAPPNSENWFVLVNVKAGAVADWERYGDAIIDKLGVRERIVFREDLSPQFYEQRYGAPGGAIYGTSSDGRAATFLRAGNRGSRRGLYVVGGSSHPGGGLPLVLTSARIVANAISADGWQ